MKMASGYFAYHGQVDFASGLIIEIQIYSSLMKSWRKLSHKLYEKARVRTKAKQLDYGTTETRLISLGHLLHLAECELTRLDNEL
jgi:ppGpp synthetase/RelA/SpoT-type nucleotidyltranferase